MDKGNFLKVGRCDTCTFHFFRVFWDTLLGPNNHGFKKSACILYGSYTFKMPMGIL